MTDSLTVVVTNFGRAEMLSRCLNSVIHAGIRNIVVSSFCAGPDEMRVIQQFAGIPGVNLTASVLPHDLGVNELWLRGLYKATTKYVLILHDDDWLNPCFKLAWPELSAHLEAGCGLVSWKGDQHNPDGKVVHCEYFSGDTRVLSTAALTEVLMRENSGPISPVVSIFRRADAIRFLKEAGDKLRNPQSFTRPSMVLGNELLLYLRICEKYESWFYYAKALTNYGAHAGSETYSHTLAGKEKQFCAAYNIIRDYFSSHRALTFRPTGRLLHFWSTHTSKDAETERRNRFAEHTWDLHYALGDVIPFPITDAMLSRSSKTEVGDTRPLPYLKDILNWGAEVAQPEDLVIFTNMDTCVTPDLPRQLRDTFTFRKLTAGFAWRHNFYTPITTQLRVCDQGFKDGGVDLVAFYPEWWREVREYMPDMLLACEAWDWCLRLIVAESQPDCQTDIDNLIYHEWHDAPWRDSTFRLMNPGQVVNRRLGKNFFVKRSELAALVGL